MEYRYLGRSGLRVSTLTMGTMTFGGGGDFAKVGASDLGEARRLIDLCLDGGVNLIDTANVYSMGASEEIIGQAVAGRRHDLLIASKVRFRMGEGQNDEGLSRWHILRQVEASLKRLGTDVIDILYLHEWDGMTPLDETLGALDTLIAQGKVRYAGASNYSGWHLMKALATAERHGLPRLVTQQIHYSLEAREAEYELAPIAVSEGVGILVWSPARRRATLGQVRPRAGLGPPARRLERAADPRRRPALANRRRPEGDRCRARRLRRAGRAGLAARPPRRRLAGDRRPQRRAVPRQPRRRRPQAHRRGARPPRPSQRAAGPLSLLAPVRLRPPPLRGGRPRLPPRPDRRLNRRMALPWQAAPRRPYDRRTCQGDAGCRRATRSSTISPS